MSGFLPTGRSGLGASSVGVAGRRWRSRWKIFSGIRGDLMAAEDFEDEGGVVRVRHDH